MALIRFDQVAHSYDPDPRSADAYALKRTSFTWADGGAYALLGPSGCGKSTLLNICSGLLRPSEGRVWFDDTDVTDLTPEKRNIAQVFQFPVLYDSMTVYDNLAFPLRNRGVPKQHIKERVHQIAAMLGLEEVLNKRASGLGAELKQEISMGRGLVRDDTSAILFDEPLTVIDPQLKWYLRRQLKEIHQHLNRTMIYVTHDQTEALTFAEKVVVMSAGEMVQVGTPQELFERPEHTFVGYFIGSPGMNFLPCTIDNGAAVIDGHRVALEESQAHAVARGVHGQLKLGIRPEYVELGANGQGLTLKLERVDDMGQFRLVTGSLAGQVVRLKVPAEHGPVAGPEISVVFPARHTCLYADDRLVQTRAEVAHG